MRTVSIVPGNAALIVARGSGSHLLFNSDQATTIFLGDNPSIDPAYGDNTVALSPQSWLVFDGKDNVYGVAPAGESAIISIYKGGTTFFQASVPVANPGQGIKILTGGGTITAAQILAYKTAGFQGLLLDSLFPWDMSGLSLNGIQNFSFEAHMLGSVGWTGNISYNSPAFVKTDTGGPVDGVSIFASNPGSAPTQGIVFRNMVFVGNHSGSVLHMGGGQRRCGFEECFAYNTRNTANSFGFALDSGLSDNNSEDNIIRNCTFAGNWAAIAIGVFDQTQHPNDQAWYDITTAGGQYGIVKNNGGGHVFYNYYDRSNPAQSTVWHHGGSRIIFVGGEDQNNTGTSHLIDNAGSQTILENRTITNPTGIAGFNTVQVSAGSLVLRGSCGMNNTQQFTTSIGAGIIDLSDPAISAGNVTITGSNAAAVVMVAGNYAGAGSAPITSSFSGIVTNPAFPSGGWTALNYGASGYVNSGTGVNGQFRQEGDEIIIVGDVTSPASPNVVMATLPAGFNVPHNQPITVIDRTTNTPVGILRVQGSPANLTMAGQTAAHELAFNGRVYTTA